MTQLKTIYCNLLSIVKSILKPIWIKINIQPFLDVKDYYHNLKYKQFALKSVSILNETLPLRTISINANLILFINSNRLHIFRKSDSELYQIKSNMYPLTR